MSGTYDVAQVCPNGHVITAYASSYPQHRQEFCAKCGAQTIMSCQACGADIPGDYLAVGIIGGPEYQPPAYCIKCGAPFPWMTTRLSAAKALAVNLANLSETEQRELEAAIDDMAKDTPMAQVSAGRFKRLVLKSGASALDGFRTILVDVVSEAVKKVIWP